MIHIAESKINNCSSEEGVVETMVNLQSEIEVNWILYKAEVKKVNQLALGELQMVTEGSQLDLLLKE
jgi:hypothetical protein